LFYDPITSWPCKQPKTKIWLVQRFKPRRFENVRFFLIWPDSAAKLVISSFVSESTRFQPNAFKRRYSLFRREAILLTNPQWTVGVTMTFEIKPKKKQSLSSTFLCVRCQLRSDQARTLHVFTNTSERAMWCCDDNSWQGASQLMCIKAPLLEGVKQLMNSLKNPEMLFLTRCWCHVFPISQRRHN